MGFGNDEILEKTLEKKTAKDFNFFHQTNTWVKLAVKHS
jgi:hypothetical protein